MGGLATAYAGVYTKLRFGVADEDRRRAGAGQDPRRPRPPRGRARGGAGADTWSAIEFTVADLTAASLFYPVVLPDEGPTEGDGTAAAGMEAFRDPLKERPGYLWVEEMFRRHRKPVAVATA